MRPAIETNLDALPQHPDQHRPEDRVPPRSRSGARRREGTVPKQVPSSNSFRNQGTNPPRGAVIPEGWCDAGSSCPHSVSLLLRRRRRTHPSFRSHDATTQGGLPPIPVPSVASPADARPWTNQELRHRCGTVNVASDRYGSHIHPQRGVPGETVVVTGTTFRGEDWRFFPSDGLVVWWNPRVPASGVPAARPLKPGPII